MRWKKIEGVVGPECEVSDTGLVRQKEAFINFKSVKNHMKLVHSAGKLKFCMFYGGGKQQLRYIHKLVAAAFVPNPKGLPYVLFIGDQSDPSANNLRWSGHRGCGTRNVTHGSVLDVETVRRIKTDLASGVKPSVVAHNHGTSRDMISHIKAGRRWANV